MSCSGIHCAGCAGGAAVPVVPLLAAFGLAWVAEHIVEVAVVSAACGALAVAAVVALMRWSDRRDARHAALGPLMVTRAAPAALPRPERQAIAPAAVNFNFYNLPAIRQAEVIRNAIEGET